MDPLAYLAWTQNPLFERALVLGLGIVTVEIVLAALGYIILKGRGPGS